jgi:hypothetical protein
MGLGLTDGLGHLRGSIIDAVGKMRATKKFPDRQN